MEEVFLGQSVISGLHYKSETDVVFSCLFLSIPEHHMHLVVEIHCGSNDNKYIESWYSQV